MQLRDDSSHYHRVHIEHAEVLLHVNPATQTSHDWRELMRQTEWRLAEGRRADMAGLPAINCALLRTSYEDLSPLEAKLLVT
eukprot:1440883-Amphidinium_carterae.1